MSTWNYRIVRRESGDSEEPYVFGVHEAFYRDGEEKPWAITEEPVGAISETLAGVSEVMEMMRFAAELPALDYKTREEIAA